MTGHQRRTLELITSDFLNVSNVSIKLVLTTDYWSHLVYRIHWLRARAQKNRWTEELSRTKHEMTWVTRFFMYQALQWDFRQISSGSSDNAGFQAYSAQKVDMWNEFGRVADAKFAIANKNYVQCWKPSQIL